MSQCMLQPIDGNALFFKSVDDQIEKFKNVHLKITESNERIRNCFKELDEKFDGVRASHKDIKEKFDGVRASHKDIKEKFDGVRASHKDIKEKIGWLNEKIEEEKKSQKETNATIEKLSKSMKETKQLHCENRVIKIKSEIDSTKTGIGWLIATVTALAVGILLGIVMGIFGHYATCATLISLSGIGLAISIPFLVKNYQELGTLEIKRIKLYKKLEDVSIS
jgi:archaellum component FlaC